MKITILETSDMHGYILPTNYTARNMDLPFSMAKAQTKMEELSEVADGPVIKIENGDILQGSALAYYLAKQRKNGISELTAVTNSFGYDVGLLGNHEFNYGIDYLKSYIDGADYPILTANVFDESGNLAFGPAYKIIEKDGIKIAVVGLLTQFIPHWEQPEIIKGLTFKSIVEVAKELLPKLRELADITIVAYHGGFERDLETGLPSEALTGENEGYQLLTECGQWIDAFVSGHQHRKIAQNVLGVPVVQPGYRGETVGEITLEFDEKTKKVTATTAQLHETGTSKISSKIQKIISETHEAAEDWLDTPMGKISGDMTISQPSEARIHEHPYIEFVNKVQMEATGCKISGTSLFNNEAKGFGQIVTMRDILTNYIYPNTLAVLRVTGRDLKAALEHTAEHLERSASGDIIFSPRFIEPKPQYYNYDMYEGIDYTIDLKKPVGSRITRLEIDGKSVSADEFLDIVVNQYRAVGGGNYDMFSADKIIKEVTVDMTELIAEYLKAHPVVEATANHNFEVLK
ncbi:MAG: bifunctional metallophosphatase/5'-nucleotidase [Streptococcaceae bacterium]|nr:bifunctional metallophosphatase/5'-nucleotidase [Streptococcaceae bacterium]